ncbi:MAG: glycosyltransferase family 4 protein [Nitrospiraceae bacterium]|nr:MAG: glycosyltransferase family 4 protein [Nitrospiraceae bacterium]
MKIAFITKRVSQSFGGAEMVSLNLGKKLAETGHEVHIFTNTVDSAIDGVHIHCIKVNKWLSPWKLISFQRKVKRKIESDRFDLVYGLCQVYPVDIYRVGDGIHQHWMKVQYPNIIVRWIKYLTSLVHLAMRWLENQIFKKGNCTFFIVNSRLIKNQILDYFHIPEDKVKVIYNGVNHDVFNPGVKIHRKKMREKFKIGNDEIVLLFVSNNWERKGLSTIIEAMSRTRIEKIRLIVVGRGKKSSYISLANHEKIDSGKLIFTGCTEHVERYYGMSDIFVLPSRYEPFANVSLEAMACGLPVITTKDNGASELISRGENGFIIDSWKDVDGLAKIIVKLIQDNVIREMGFNAAEKAKNYHWDKHVKETNTVFNMLINAD